MSIPMVNPRSCKLQSTAPLAPHQLNRCPHRSPLPKSHDREQIITTSPDEDITRLYDLEGNLLAEYLGSTVSSDPKYYGLSLGFTKDGTQILTLTSDGTLRVWDIDAGLTIDGGLDDLLRRGCAELKNFRHREDVRKVCPEN